MGKHGSNALAAQTFACTRALPSLGPREPPAPSTPVRVWLCTHSWVGRGESWQVERRGWGGELCPRSSWRHAAERLFFSFIASWGPWGKATCPPGCQRASPYPSLTQPPHTVALAVVSDASVGSCRISVREPVAWPGKRSCGILASLRGRHGLLWSFFLPRGAWPTFDFLAPPSYSLTSPRFPATQVLRVLVQAPHGGGHP